MTWKKEYNRSLIGGIIFIALVYYLTPIFVYIFLSAILSAAGRPLMNLLGKLKIKGKSFSATLRAVIVLFTMIFVVVLLASVLAPAVAEQAESIRNINIDSVSSHLDKDMGPVKDFLSNHSMINKKTSLRQTIRTQLLLLIRGVNFNSVFSSFLGVTGELFMGAFSILFMTFFFLQDETLFNKIVMIFVSKRNHQRVESILIKVRKTLGKYFTGLLIEISSMMFLISIGGTIIGLKNAILIGFIGGLLNVIPYLGPLIGAIFGSSLVLIANIDMGIAHSFFLAGQVLLIFGLANLIDNFLLQPIIYSNSVNIHPLAIFIIIFVGGYIGGPLGMIIAIPTFTVLRIILVEFFPNDPFVQNIAQGM